MPHEVDRIDAIVSRLLDFARPRPVTLRAHPIEKTVREVLVLVENQMREAGVRLETVYEAGVSFSPITGWDAHVLGNTVVEVESAMTTR